MAPSSVSPESEEGARSEEPSYLSSLSSPVWDAVGSRMVVEGDSTDSREVSMVVSSERVDVLAGVIVVGMVVGERMLFGLKNSAVVVYMDGFFCGLLFGEV